MSNLPRTEVLERSYVKGTDVWPELDMTIGKMFDESVATYSKRLAVSSPGQDIRWSYDEFNVQVNNLASGLISLGLEPGDRLGIWCANRAEWAVTHFAAAKLGLILVCINPAYCPAELEHAVDLVECKALIMAERLKNTDYVALLQEVAPELSGSSPGHLVAARLPSLKIVIKLGDETAAGCFRYSDVLNMGSLIDCERLLEIGKTLSPRDMTAILFTSGTTGGPKGVAYDHYQLLNSAFIDGRAMEICSDSAICVQLPLFHLFGLLVGNLAGIILGANVVYPAEVFDPETMLSAIESEKCTVVYGVPTLYKALLDFPGLERFDLTSLRSGLIAGATGPFDLCENIIERLHVPGLLHAYGMTELGGTVTLPRMSDSVERRVGTAGKVKSNIEIKLIDASGNIVPVGSPGELCVRGITVMKGYWGDSKKTASAIDSEGWFRSGDLATVDADGYFKIIARIKDIIIRGGEKISPVEIEACLMLNEKILSAVVVAVPDDKYGEEVCACVLLKPGMSTTEEEIRSFCRGKITFYKIPRYVLFVTSYPMTASGKVRRHVLKEQSCESLGFSKTSQCDEALFDVQANREVT